MSITAESGKDTLKQSLLYIVLAIVIILIFYIIFQAVQLFNKPANYVLAQDGRITNYEDAVAYVIRDEKVIDTKDYSGKREAIIMDSNRVSKNGAIAYYIGNDNDNLQKRIDEIDNEIQSIMENADITYSQEIKAFDKSIEEKIYKLVSKKNEINSIRNVKSDIVSELENKITQLGKSIKDDELNNLLKERSSIEKEQEQNKVEITADEAGLVSYRVDGYESVFNPESFTSITIDKLSNIKYVTNQIIPISENKIKIINNFYVYLAVVAKSEESKKLHLNDTVKLSLDGDLSNYERATVEYIAKEGEDRLIIFKITKNIDKLSMYRKVNVDLIWWNYEGIRVPDEAISEKKISDFYPESDNKILTNSSGELIDKDQTISVIKVLGVTGYKKDIYVKVINSAKGFSIIENYDDDELLMLGVPEETINSRSKVNVYDKVVVE